MTMTRLPYDLSDPPFKPPAECRHELLWLLARSLREAHEADADGFCVVTACRRHHLLHPCPPSRLADDGVRSACRSVSEPQPSTDNQRPAGE
jgi:hypothetical protein